MNMLLSLTLLLFFNASQNPALKEVKELYNEGKFKEARAKIKKINTTDKNGVEILFYKALLAGDAEESVGFFKKILNKYPQSDYSDCALYGVSQYEFLQGSYKDAILTLKSITTSFPESKYYGSSCLWLASSYEALNDTVNAVNWYKKVSNSDTFTSHIAKEALSGLAKKKRSIYSIQIGFFQNRKSAENLIGSFKEKGYDTWLATTQQEGTKYYRILIGEFESKEKAEGFSKLFSEQEKIPFWIVKIKKLKHMNGKK